MGIFSFLKKFGREDKVEEKVTEKMAFSDVENWLDKKKGENEAKEKEILSMIGEKIESFTKELREKIVILQGFDVEAKKEKDHIKNIVIDSREKYIESVEDLIEKFTNLKEPKLEKFIEKINKIFFEFDKSSFKNYERTTILIGKEMATIKESLKVFSKDLLKIFDENKSVVDSFKNLLIIKEKLNTITPIDKTLEGINEKKSSLTKKISEKEEENRILKEKIEEIKKSQDYLDLLASQEKIESLKLESKENILELKQLLDFKALANFFHINQEQMKMVKNHKEDFYKHFIKDEGKSITSLLDEAKLNNDKIAEEIGKIYSKLEETRNHEQEIKKDETQEIYPQIKESVLGIDILKIEKIKEEKRHEKLRTNKEELSNMLKQELGKMNIEVI